MAEAAARLPQDPPPAPAPRHQVFVTGATGYLGSRLVPALAARGHRVTALVREAAAARAPAGCRIAVGDALDAASVAARLGEADTLVHLVGVAHPSPRKAREFLTVDLASLRAAAQAARAGRVRHFVYLSVAQPAPAMAAYVAARAQGEALVRETGIPATLVRPWYVLGPGHRWPLVLKPWYALAERIPATRELARRLGLVSLDEMIGALVACVEAPPAALRIVAVPEIRRLGSGLGEVGQQAPGEPAEAARER